MSAQHCGSAVIFAAGDPKTDHEVHLNLEELLELQHHREPVSFFLT